MEKNELLAGPIFSRDALTIPRQLRHYLLRSGYVAALLVLMYTMAQATFGWQQVSSAGDMARYSSLVFQVFSLLEVTLALFFGLLFAAGRVAHEKDGQTLVLLLMSDLRDGELVAGKLLSSLLVVGVLLAASVPVFVSLHTLGGVGLDQVFWSLAIAAAAGLAAGSWGTLVAFWREKTFQTLAVSVLGMVLFLGAVEAVVAVAGPGSPVGRWAGLLNPYRALIGVLNPLAAAEVGRAARVSAWQPVLALVSLAVVLAAVTVRRLRVWNPTRFVHETAIREDAEQAATKRSRAIWRNPIIWREIRTRAYGRKAFALKLAYFALAGFAVYWLRVGGEGEAVLGMISPSGFAFVGLAFVGLLLVNAQAVTSFTSERDGKTLELLLVTDVTAREFVYGKLGGIVYNTKELILIPLALAAWYAWSGALSWEHLRYVVVGFSVLVAFASMLGLHAGLSYDSSRMSIAVSLGTMFFLFIGILIFLLLLVEARASFLLQFQSFVVFIGAGSIGLWAALTHKNRSTALTISALVLPFLSFYAITEFLLGGSLGICLAITAAYGFTTLAMLVPAVSDFDMALGRTAPGQG